MAVRCHHAVFEFVISSLRSGLLPQSNRAFPVFWMKVAGPEIRLGQPTFQRIAQDFSSLLTHEQELLGGGVRFPDNRVEGLNQPRVSLRFGADKE
jgi:hypothetical protein